LSPEQQLKLFNEVSQADQSTTRKFGGTGLGLVISKRIIENMGGNIHIDSELNKGSTFSVLIPMKSHLVRGLQTEKIQQIKEKKLDVDLSGFSILLVEDNPINVKVMDKMIKKLKGSYTLAQNGQEAVEAFKHHPFQLILMDLQMPIMDGFEASRIILTQTSSNFKPFIIALTANVSKEDHEKCEANGMKGFISKPVTLSSLKKGLNSFIRKAQRD
jgi:CheY-like chemotaxis protein